MGRCQIPRPSQNTHNNPVLLQMVLHICQYKPGPWNSAKEARLLGHQEVVLQLVEEMREEHHN